MLVSRRKCKELSFRHVLFNVVMSHPSRDSSRWLAQCVLAMVAFLICLISSNFTCTPVTNLPLSSLGHSMFGSALGTLGFLFLLGTLHGWFPHFIQVSIKGLSKRLFFPLYMKLPPTPMSLSSPISVFFFVYDIYHCLKLHRSFICLLAFWLFALAECFIWQQSYLTFFSISSSA